MDLFTKNFVGTTIDRRPVFKEEETQVSRTSNKLELSMIDGRQKDKHRSKRRGVFPFTGACRENAAAI